VIEVRSVQPGDGAFLLQTTQELGRSHGWFDKMTATAESFEAALFCDNPIIGAAVGLVDGQPAGTALWHRSFSTMRGREVMYLEDLVVLPDFRRKGIAEALMKVVAKEAVSRGYQDIFWLMMAWNKDARKFYEKLGASIEDGNCYCLLSDKALQELAK
jgi:GNAT superfamily N-acetyltransferase